MLLRNAASAIGASAESEESPYPHGFGGPRSGRIASLRNSALPTGLVMVLTSLFFPTGLAGTPASQRSLPP